jgi:hypothetical protein
MSSAFRLFAAVAQGYRVVGEGREGGDERGGSLSCGAFKRQAAFHAGTVRIPVFIEMNFSNTVVVQSDGLADGILSDFQSAVQIAPEASFKKKPHG